MQIKPITVLGIWRIKPSRRILKSGWAESGGSPGQVGAPPPDVFFIR